MSTVSFPARPCPRRGPDRRRGGPGWRQCDPALNHFPRGNASNRIPTHPETAAPTRIHRRFLKHLLFCEPVAPMLARCGLYRYDVINQYEFGPNRSEDRFPEWSSGACVPNRNHAAASASRQPIGDQPCDNERAHAARTVTATVSVQLSRQRHRGRIEFCLPLHRRTELRRRSHESPPRRPSLRPCPHVARGGPPARRTIPPCDGFQSPAAGPASGRLSPESHDAIVTINAWS